MTTTAKLIGETSAGMTAVEIYNESDDLIWSYRWFDNGCTTSGYIAGLKAVYDCMSDCEDATDFDGGEVNEDGEPLEMDTESTTGIILTYDKINGWIMEEDARRYGQSTEIIDALMNIGLLDADVEHEEFCDSDIVIAITNHINKSINK